MWETHTIRQSGSSGTWTRASCADATDAGQLSSGEKTHPPPPQTKSPRFKTLLRYSSYTFEYQEAQMPNQTAEFLIPESYHASPGLSQKFWTGRTVP